MVLVLQNNNTKQYFLLPQVFPFWKQQLRLLSVSWSGIFDWHSCFGTISGSIYLISMVRRAQGFFFDIDSRYETQTVCRSIQTSINGLYLQGLLIVNQLKDLQWCSRGLSLLGYISESLLCERSVKRHNLPPGNIQVGHSWELLLERLEASSSSFNFSKWLQYYAQEIYMIIAKRIMIGWTWTIPNLNLLVIGFSKTNSLKWW